VAANVTGAIEGRDPEYLHQLRVGIRRLRTVFRIFKAKRLDKQLRKLARPLGEARDWDVFVARHEKGAAGRRAAHRRSRRVLQSAEFRAFIVEAQQVDARAGGAPLTAFAAKALDRLHRKALQRARKIDWRKAKRRHRVRIAARRLRYACDFFSPCFADARSYLHALAHLQDLLGELNDIAVARRLGAPKAALARRERGLVSELAPAWKAFERRPRFWAGTERPPAKAR
jgi:CHAD domain-containing protein